MKFNYSTSKIWTIIQHEYLSKVKSKGFIISTILGPIMLVLLIAVPVIVTILTGSDTDKRIAILDYTKSNLGEIIVQKDTTKFFLSKYREPDLRNMVLKEELDGYLIIPEDVTKQNKVTVYTRGGGGFGFIRTLESTVGGVVRKQRLIETGTDTSIIKIVEKSIDIETKKVTAKGTEKDYTEAFAGLGYFLGLMIYMMMFMYGSFVMRGVIEEKANRIIEVIASSARPFEIMFGKVIGVGAVGLTQVLFWVAAGSALFAAAGPIIGMFTAKSDIMQQEMVMGQPAMQNMPGGFELPHISIWLIIGFIVFFLYGYFIYSTLFAAVGSAVDQESDAQQLMMPVTLPIVIPILFIGSVISNPDGGLAVVLSLIPLFTPILMIVRVAATDVPLWQIILSLILMTATFFGCLWLAAKIYRTGILMYGKKPQFKDIIKWIKMAK